MGEAKKFYETMALLQTHAQMPACPIYAISENEDVGALVGSGFLLDIADKTFLVTAAHVFYLRHEYGLYLPGAGKPASFGGQAFYTGPTKLVDQPDFGYDFACIQLAPGSADACAGCLRLTPGDLDVSDFPQPQTLYGFVGFPGEANETLADSSLPRNAHYYGGQPAGPDVYAALDYRAETHFSMKFDVDAMVDDRHEIVPASAPPGMSGGPVWRGIIRRS